jgi:hypothetical protein
MSDLLHGLVEGERDYLHGFAAFLDDVRSRAEAATGLAWGSEELLRHTGGKLIQLMREKRQALSDEVGQIRQAADQAIAALS